MVFVCNCRGLNKEAVEEMSLEEHLRTYQCGMCLEDVFRIKESLVSLFNIKC